MNKKILAVIIAAQLLLIGSIIVIGSDNAKEMNNLNDEIKDVCQNNNGDCLRQGNGCGYGKSTEKQNCDGSGLCAQECLRNSNCDNECDGPRSNSQNTQQICKCDSQSRCSDCCTPK